MGRNELLIGLGALAVSIVIWILYSLRRKPDQELGELYAEVLTSRKYAVKGRFEE